MDKFILNEAPEMMLRYKIERLIRKISNYESQTIHSDEFYLGPKFPITVKMTNSLEENNNRSIWVMISYKSMVYDEIVTRSYNCEYEYSKGRYEIPRLVNYVIDKIIAYMYDCVNMDNHTDKHTLLERLKMLFLQRK